MFNLQIHPHLIIYFNLHIHRNDGNVPEYMAADATKWLTSTSAACCEKYFGGYNYQKCMRMAPPGQHGCNSGSTLFYPDWHGANRGCVDDGKYLASTLFNANIYLLLLDAKAFAYFPSHVLHIISSSSSSGGEPYYMLSNHNFFIFKTREECCKTFYSWDYYGCTGTSPALTHGGYYPNWTRSIETTTCLNDGNYPAFMFDNQSWYFAPTLRECCEKHMHWKFNECIGAS